MIRDSGIRSVLPRSSSSTIRSEDRRHVALVPRAPESFHVVRYRLVASRHPVVDDIRHARSVSYM